MKHENKIAHYNSFEELAEDIGNLRYDALQELMSALYRKILRDERNDLKNGRGKLSMCLRNTAGSLEQAAKHVGKAWIICEPYIDKK